MSKWKYNEIWRCLNIDIDKWIGRMNQEFNKHKTITKIVCLDESMIPFKSRRNPHFIFVPRKPHPVGIKLFTAADSDTFIFKLLMKKRTEIHPQQPLLHRTKVEFNRNHYEMEEEVSVPETCLKLTNSLKCDKHIVVCDKWFGSLSTLCELKRVGIDTVMKTKDDRPKALWERLHQTECNKFGYRIGTAKSNFGDKIYVYSRNDKNVCDNLQDKCKYNSVDDEKIRAKKENNYQNIEDDNDDIPMIEISGHDFVESQTKSAIVSEKENHKDDGEDDSENLGENDENKPLKKTQYCKKEKSQEEKFHNFISSTCFEGYTEKNIEVKNDINYKEERKRTVHAVEHFYQENSGFVDRANQSIMECYHGHRSPDYKASVFCFFMSTIIHNARILFSIQSGNKISQTEFIEFLSNQLYRVEDNVEKHYMLKMRGNRKRCAICWWSKNNGKSKVSKTHFYCKNCNKPMCSPCFNSVDHCNFYQEKISNR